ncbi:MAG TPA: ATP-binding protein [Thermomicrobiales bacterium]|nr:ATP-binding protein [Thermomicrobiales bacterium]
MEAPTPRRVAIEAAIVTFLLTLLMAVLFAGVSDPERRASALAVGPVGVGILAGVAAALRLRRGGDCRRWYWVEIASAWMASVAIWAGAALALFVGELATGVGMVEQGGGPGRWSAAALGGFAAAVALVAYAVARGTVLAWPTWDRLRRTRLLWALTHAQLASSLSLTLVVAGLLSISALVGISTGAWSEAFAEGGLGGGAVITFLARVVEGGVPATLVFLLASLVVGVLVVIPIALISVVVLPRTTRRLEALAAATAALRAGDLGARVAIGGEDEVARLQADFNAMAADLERSLAALAAERDAVARLLADRRELVAAVSHELRTPVATLRVYLDSVASHWDGKAPPATLRDDLVVMADETDRLGRLIEDLFILSRTEIGRLPLTLRPTDAGALLQRAAAAVAPLAWERGRVEVLAEVPTALSPALADPDRLEQVVRNLVANAVRHTPPGGFVLLAAAAEGDTLLLQVKDTGEGIAPADLPHVWDRFYRAGSARERDGGGAGLGLALVKELTEAMGGSVGVESTPGAGSCFSLRLPVARTPR